MPKTLVCSLFWLSTGTPCSLTGESIYCGGMENDGMTQEAMENRDAIKSIASDLNRGLITYIEAQAKAKPFIDRINKRGEELAKEHGMKHKPITFRYLMR